MSATIRPGLQAVDEWESGPTEHVMPEGGNVSELAASVVAIVITL